MSTNNDEATQYQFSDDNTQFEGTSFGQEMLNDNKPTEVAQSKPAKKNGLKKAAVGAASGLLIGGVSTVLMSMKSADSDINDSDTDNNSDTLSNPEWVDDQVQVATTVSDDMSFSEAFAAARNEVGAGGCFEWNGNIYGTYTANEWDNMTAEQRAGYSDHFSWNHIDSSKSDIAHHSSHVDNTGDNGMAVIDDIDADPDADIEVVSVDHADGHSNLAQNEQMAADGDIDVITAEPEVEILGVFQDSDSGSNIASMTVDNQEVVLIDVDGNMTFDYLATDANGNGQVDEGELVDISDQGLTVNDLGGFSDSSDMYASNDAPDYSADSYGG